MMAWVSLVLIWRMEQCWTWTGTGEQTDSEEAEQSCWCWLQERNSCRRMVDCLVQEEAGTQQEVVKEVEEVHMVHTHPHMHHKQGHIDQTFIILLIV